MKNQLLNAAKAAGDTAKSILLPGEWPLPSFHFTVTFHNPLFLAMDMGFQDVSGLDSEIEVEEYREGGRNNFVYHLPKAVKQPNLTLKRSIGPVTSPLVHWCRETFSKDFVDIKLLDLTVMLLNEHRLPVRTWSFFDAYPVNWKVDNFNSTKNEVAVEEIKLCYGYGFRGL